MNPKRVAGLVLGVGVVLVLVTLAVPLYDYPPGFKIGEPSNLLDFFRDGRNLLAIVGVLAAVVLAVLAVLGKTNRGWGIVALLAGLALGASLLMADTVGMACWDGTDEQGRSVGDCASSRPVLGWWLALVGAALVSVAGAIRLAAARMERPAP